MGVPQLAEITRAINAQITERNLKITSAVLLALSLALIISLSIVSMQTSEIAYELVEEKHRICLTPECITKASKVLNNMDSSIDPCEDFYQFACGGFLNKTNIPDDQASVTSYTKVKNVVYQQIRNMLEEPPREDELPPFVLTKQFYNSCVNTSAIESDGLTTMKELLDSLGGWPVLDGENWYDEKFDWRQSMYTLRNIGYDANYFLSVKVIIDPRNSSRMVISINPATLTFEREVLLDGLDHSLMQLYFDYMVDVAVMFGANRSKASEELVKSLDFEIAISNISTLLEQNPDEAEPYNAMTVFDLQRRFPDTSWKQYLKYLLDISDFEITNDQIVIVTVPQYLDDLVVLLETSSKRDQANYIMWRVVLSSLNYLTEEARNLQFKYFKGVTGIRQPLPRWKDCIYQTLYRLWTPLQALYDHNHFSKRSRKMATEMMSDIEEEFQIILRSTEWMDENSTKSALEKSVPGSIYINSLEPEDYQNLTQYYSRLGFNSKNYLRVVLAVSLFNDNHYFRRLLKPVEEEQIAKEISLEYQIYVPGGLFQDDFYNALQPHYMNYGAIGVLMGHLISHNFDKKGRQVNKDGYLFNWWTEDTENAFNERAKCIEDQFSNYSVAEVSLNLNGNNTRDENIADGGAFKVAYLAYNSWVKRNGPEPHLPGLNYTSEQMFWISGANMYCAKHRPEQLKSIVLTLSASPEYYRVVGSFANSEYFAKDFKCPLGSKMNPEKKCKIW